MEEKICRQLVDLNAHFYQEFGRAFSATRQRIQPGIQRLVRSLPLKGRWLDLGCGNGALAHWLVKNEFSGQYLGLDFSPALLAEAQRELQPGAISFQQADLSAVGWDVKLPAGEMDVVLSFAALHHLPGAALRRCWLSQVAGLLAPGGCLALSVWQFQHSPKLLARCLPWEQVGLNIGQLETGDTLLDWRYALPGQAEKVGLRYVHLFTAAELVDLAQPCGLHLEQSFESDGQGGRLGLYQLWRKAG
jgi:tRNA (uracil-5-)-methyltransferase TRM9